MSNTDICYDIYVSSYNNIIRETNMRSRFSNLNIEANIYSFKETDPRVTYLIENGINKDDARGCFFNALKMIEDFYNNSIKEFGVFFENDIFLKKSLEVDLLNACNNMKTLNLDVLMIGYLINNTPEVFGCHFIHTDNNNKYYNYPDDLWGTQGFILTKKQAKFYIDKYTIDYVLDPNKNETIAADWVYTKNGNRALLYPPLVVEEGVIAGDHYGQVNFHKTCKEFLYNDSYTL